MIGNVEWRELCATFCMTRAARVLEIACDSRKQKLYRLNRPLEQQGMWREKWVAARNFLHFITSFSASGSWLVRALPLQSILLKKGTINLVFYLHTIYHTYHIVSWRFTILLWGEIRRYHVKAPLTAAISPYFDLTHPPTQHWHVLMWKTGEIRDRDRPPHQRLRPLLFTNRV